MILTSVGIKAIDSFYKQKNGIDDYELVKIAASSIFKEIIDVVKSKTVLVVCGKGLNGCDGLALALLLHENGITVSVHCTERSSEITNKLYVECKEKCIISEEIREVDVIIDAYFGIGFHGEFDSASSELFKRINDSKSFKIALDVPSGVNADNCETAENAFKADMTVAVCTKKPCHLFYPSKGYCGTITVADMPYGNDIMSKAQCDLFEINNEAYKSILKNRPSDSFKSTFGKAGLVIGSENYVGAAIFSANACARCGVGMISAFIPNIIYTQFSSNCPNAVIYPQNTINGGINNLKLYVKLDDFTSILCGCGLGLSKNAESIVKQVASVEVPVVFDADALTHLSKNIGLLKRTSQTVITPHIGEFARISNISISELKSKRLYYVKKFASEYSCVVVLKDSVTVIASPDGQTFVLSNPTSALAKGGSGDVLAGMVCSFMAQGYSSLDSALISVSLHNKCAHETAKTMGDYGTLPQDIIANIPYQLNWR